MVFEDALSGVEAGQAGASDWWSVWIAASARERLTESGADVVVDDLGELASS